MRGSGPLGRLAANAGVGARRLAGRALLPRGPFWLRLRVPSPLPERPPPPLWPGRTPPFTLRQALELLEAAARHPRVAGVALRLEGPPGGLARALSLRRAVAAVRAAGRPVVAWSAALGAEDGLVASAASRLYLPPSGQFQWLGLKVDAFFVRGLLARLGLRPDVVRIGSYKGAAEPFVRDAMSPEQREQLEAWLEDAFAAVCAGVAEGRGLDAGSVRALADAGPFSAAAAAEAGLVDDALYPDQVEDELLRLAPQAVGREGRPALVDAPMLLALGVTEPGLRPLLRPLPTVAYVVASGAVHRGGRGRGIGADPYRELLGRLAEDDAVRAIVLRVDSPGGDAIASDLLFRAARRAAARKPVVASLGDVAASGGYFLAAGADAILAEAATLTGSIGVVGGKLDASGLYERIGVARETLERGARAGLLSEARGFRPDERRALRTGMEALYDLFVRRVAEGRHLEPSEVRRVAEGRVWSGAAARERGLVDALGGPLEAVAEARRRAGLAPEEAVRVVSLPPPVSLLARLPRPPGLLGALALRDESAPRL
ncbi:MAG: signal peptide peptidase SppA [Myxococcota bacterium]|nr:signal peptide peptidase SppA [Myxococcota bacterium]